MDLLNIGILAHVDAGKTSLTERLLFEAGVIDRIGSVDKGSTQTDSLEMERSRGITIQSGVVSFTLDGVRVNLIDTPGHSDFIAEVERALRVLDGAVLVVSAVEGVQAQTRVLMRTLMRLRIPTLVFVNKIDRRGARDRELLASVRERLAVACVAVNEVTAIGTPDARACPRPPQDPGFMAELAEVLAEHDDVFLAAYLGEGPPPTAQRYRDGLAAQSRASLVCPVVFGSAVTGQGVPELIRGMRDFLTPVREHGPGGLRATVFKIERGRADEKVAFVRVHDGTLQSRETVPFYRRDQHGAVVELHGRVSWTKVFVQGAQTREQPAVAGDIAKVWGLKDIRIGDQLGSADKLPDAGVFAPPNLETMVRPERPQDGPRLFAALARMAEHDPFIGARRDRTTGDVSVRLFGEVQKEVVKATLAQDHGIAVRFEQSRTVCVERPVGVGEALEEIDYDALTYFYATVGLRVEPGEPGSGVTFRLAVELGSLPGALHKAIEETVRTTLGQGLYGWEVVDCAVTLTRTGYASPVSAAGDFRKVTPLVLMDALRQAGTTVFEPVEQIELEVPGDTVSAVLAKLAEAGAVPEEPEADAGCWRLRGTLAAGAVYELERRLPGLTRGEGMLLTRFDGYRPVVGRIPTRARTDGNPLDRKEYLVHVLNRV